MDLNSVLIEGEIVSTTEAEGDSGYWIELASKYRDCSANASLTEVYQINVINTKQYPSGRFQPGAHIRIVGCMRRSGLKGVVVLAEVVEKRVERKVMDDLENAETTEQVAT